MEKSTPPGPRTRRPLGSSARMRSICRFMSAGVGGDCRMTSELRPMLFLVSWAVYLPGSNCACGVEMCSYVVTRPCPPSCLRPLVYRAVSSVCGSPKAYRSR